jgi:hypothetical protein
LVTALSSRGKEEYGFDSLLGHTVTFVVDERKTNLALARCIMRYLAMRGLSCAVLDADAFYASNSGCIIASIPEESGTRIEFLVPDVGSNLQTEFGQLFGIDPHTVLIVDSLNSVFHLLPAEGHGSRNRNLAFVMSLFSYLSRTDRRTVFLTMYRRNSRSEGRNPISALSDQSIAVSLMDGKVLLRGRLHSWQVQGG